MKFESVPMKFINPYNSQQYEIQLKKKHYYLNQFFYKIRNTLKKKFRQKVTKIKAR